MEKLFLCSFTFINFSKMLRFKFKQVLSQNIANYSTYLEASSLNFTYFNVKLIDCLLN